MEMGIPLGSPAVKTLSFQCKGHRLNPWSSNQDPTCCMAQSKYLKKKKKGNERIEINPEKGKTKQNFVAKPTLS